MMFYHVYIYLIDTYIYDIQGDKLPGISFVIAFHPSNPSLVELLLKLISMLLSYPSI
jgi:hypothetical protein